MNRIDIKNYDLDKTLSSGQTFVWEKEENEWIGKTTDSLIVLKQNNINEILWQTYPRKNNINLVNKYLRIDYEYEKFINKNFNDKYVEYAKNKYKGLRLLHQNFFETIISFIISTNKNIPAIKSSIQKLSKLYGKEVEYNNNKYHLFPSIKELSKANINDLKSTSIGYRADYIKETAKILLNNNILNNTDKYTLQEIREELMKLKGVGDKVADCSLCYGLAIDTITPIDVWNRRVLEQYYNIRPNTSYKILREWIYNKFNIYTNILGQYLFEYIRENQ